MTKRIYSNKENRSSIIKEIENVREKWEEGQFGYLPHFSENELIEISNCVKKITELVEIAPSDSKLLKIFNFFSDLKS